MIRMNFKNYGGEVPFILTSFNINFKAQWGEGIGPSTSTIIFFFLTQHYFVFNFLHKKIGTILEFFFLNVTR